jgi:5-methylthioribose kinase
MGPGSIAIGGPDYRPLDAASVRGFLAALPVADRDIGGDPAAWSVREVGDGNLNLVFIVRGPKGGLVVKQALPYLRLVGESWPLPLERAFFESEALTLQAAAAPGLTPTLHHFDRTQAAIVMELLEPHIILRKGLILGQRYPRLAADVAEFCARTLYATSAFGAPAAETRARQALFSHNAALAKITEDLIFTDPYRIAESNRWTSPQLDQIAADFRDDAALKVAVQELKWMFLSQGEALIHGDLHTGSIMVTQTETRVIDPEFAMVGPMGFDLGAFMGNLLLAFFAQEGHVSPEDDRAAFRVWILEMLEAFWRGFEVRFLALWREGGDGDAFPPGLFADAAGAEALEAFRTRTMLRLLQESLGFAGAKMARRILGLAHVEDMESIADSDLRAACETRALRMARALMTGWRDIGTIEAVRHMAEDIAREPVR